MSDQFTDYVYIRTYYYEFTYYIKSIYAFPVTAHLYRHSALDMSTEWSIRVRMLSYLDLHLDYLFQLI